MVVSIGQVQVGKNVADAFVTTSAVFYVIFCSPVPFARHHRPPLVPALASHAPVAAARDGTIASLTIYE